MDVVNLSLGAYTSLPPDADPLAMAVNSAVAAGVTVVVSAGNDGPSTGSVTSPGTAAAAITVGATTNSRVLARPLVVSAALPVPPGLARIAVAESNGPAPQSNVGPAQLTGVNAVDASGLACAALPANSLRDQMVLIRRGHCSFSVKITNAFLAGALAVVVYNDQFGQSAFGMDVGAARQIPSVMIGNTEGAALAQFLATAGAGVQAALGASEESIPTAANFVADFSAVGPSTDFGIKPDVVAPGAFLYSATQRNYAIGSLFDPSGFLAGSGTSFSAPIVAGAAALVQQAWPAFTPAQVKSALVQTAAKAAIPAAGGVAGVLAQGNGLLDVAAALATPAVVTPTTISFGTNAPGSVLNRTISLSITNVGPAVDTFTLAAAPSPGSAAVSWIASPGTTFLLAAGATTMVGVSAMSAAPLTGVVEGTLEVRSQRTGRALTIPYWGNFLRPTVSGGALNAASLSSGPQALAPGRLVAIFGEQLTGGATEQARFFPLPDSLAGVRVVIAGVPAPLLYVSPTQINAQVPQEAALGGALSYLQIHLNGVSSAGSAVFLAPTGPGIFSVNQTGTGRAVALHAANFSEVRSENPARRGETLAVYVNGLGSTTPSVGNGQAASTSPLSVVNNPVVAILGGVAAPVRFAGLVPTLTGLYQVNIEVPSNAPLGEQPLVLISNGVASNTVTIPIGP
jgi:uncharacterized protein (TIGR03437 family)